jgi:predicted nucleic acid-binding protein
VNYLDTSVLVAALATEVHTPRAQRWLLAAEADALATSGWATAEFSSAMSLKLRMGSIDPEGRKAALDGLAAMLSDSLVLLTIVDAYFHAAAGFADRHTLGLRAPDALHLAIAAGNGATLVTLDKRLASAGKKLGVATRLI